MLTYWGKPLTPNRMVYMETARIYLRASTKRQDKSVAQQREVCLEEAKKRKLKVLSIHEDDGISGYKHGREKRQGFDELLTACEEQPTDYVVVWNFNRFTRQFADGVIEAFNLAKMGTKILDTNTGVLDAMDLGGAIQLVAAAHQANKYSSDLSKAVKRGQDDMRKNGRPIGKIPFGYMKGDDPEWIPDPETSPIVLEIFQMFESGMTYLSISKVMNERGVQRYGKSFAAHFISDMIKNPIYGGYQKDINQETPRKVNIQTFVPKAQWKFCYEKATNTYTHKTQPPRNNPLTGIVVCGECGSPAHIVGKVEFRRYRCRLVREGACDHNYTLTVPKLEASVLNLWKEAVDEYGVDRLAQIAAEIAHQELVEQQESVQPILDEIAVLDDQEDRLIDLQLEGGDTPKLAARLRKIQEQRQRLQERLQETNGETQPFTLAEAVEAFRKALDAVDGVTKLVPFIESIRILGRNHFWIRMFGWEWEVEL